MIRSFIDSLSSGEVVILAAVVSAVIAAAVSVLTTWYALKHGPNYKGQIDSLRTTIESLGRTQEELRKQQAEQAKRDEERYETERKRLEAARWKPHAEIISLNEGREHVNKLSITSIEKFRLIDVSLLSESGAKICDIFKNDLNSNVAFGQNVKIPHTELTKLASGNQSYFQNSKFEGMIRFTVERAEGETTRYTGELKFSAESIMLGNTLWFHLLG